MLNILQKIHSINNDDTINIIIEIEKGSKNKYELDKETGLIILDRVLHTSQDYPFDYGFVPNTLWHDGDPLDVVLLSTYPIKPGTLVRGRVVGYLDMIDDEESDIKIIAVTNKDPRFKNVLDLENINPHTISEIKHFFETYKDLEHKQVNIEKVGDKVKALEIVKESIELYKDKK